jgi:uncharacterized protein YaiL (DUF2058 family)
VLERILEPIAGENEAEKIITALPGQQAANFVFTSADLKPKVNTVGVRWLLTRHITLTEQDVQKHMAALVKEQEKALKEMEKARLDEEKRRAEEERRKQAEKERLKAEAERRRAEEADRLAREKELHEKKEMFASAGDEERVFDTRGRSGKVSYDDLINGFIAKIEAVARTTFGLPFLKELVKRGELNLEKAMSFYLSETRTALLQGLAKKETRDEKGKKTEYITYDFEHVLRQVVLSMGVKEPEYVDSFRLKRRFESLVTKASANNILERVLLGKPFLQF